MSLINGYKKSEEVVKMNRTYIVYKHTTPNGKIYIGITSQKPYLRWGNGKGYKSRHFYNAIQKYGWENIKHEILFTELSEEEAKLKEIELIAFYKSNQPEYGYNISSGGNTLSEETKIKIGIANKIALKGKRPSDLCISKMIEAHKNKQLSEETRKKISLSHIGIKHTEETKIKMSNARKGKSPSNKGQVGEKNYWYGKQHSEQSKEKMREIQKKLNGRKVIQLSLNGEFVKQYDCISDVVRELNIKCHSCIVNCCKGKQKKAYGFIWQYAN